MTGHIHPLSVAGMEDISQHCKHRLFFQPLSLLFNEQLDKLNKPGTQDARHGSTPACSCLVPRTLDRSNQRFAWLLPNVPLGQHSLFFYHTFDGASSWRLSPGGGFISRYLLTRFTSSEHCLLQLSLPHFPSTINDHDHDPDIGAGFIITGPPPDFQFRMDVAIKEPGAFPIFAPVLPNSAAKPSVFTLSGRNRSIGTTSSSKPVQGYFLTTRWCSNSDVTKCPRRQEHLFLPHFIHYLLLLGNVQHALIPA